MNKIKYIFTFLLFFTQTVISFQISPEWDFKEGRYFYPQLTVRLQDVKPSEVEADCLVVGVFKGGELSEAAHEIDLKTEGYIRNIIKMDKFSGEAGQGILLYSVPFLKTSRVLLIGCGSKEGINDGEFFEAVSQSIRLLNRGNIKTAVSFLPDLPVKGRDLHWKLRMAARESEYGLYAFDKLKGKVDIKENKNVFTTLVFGNSPYNGNEAAAFKGFAVAKGMALAMDIGNLPSNIATPVLFEGVSKIIQKQFPDKISIDVLDTKGMEAKKMGSFLSVAQGDPKKSARMIVVQYQGAEANEQPYALVGKGITFDTGGVSLKGSQDLHLMKYDMLGAASVLATISVLAELEWPVNVVGILACTPNMIDGHATAPGDIVKSMSGKTIEILNTDAEGRLVLADALTYAEHFRPKTIIDVATLTGAAITALGSHASVFMTNDKSLAKDLVRAGNYTYDRVWQLPLWPEYQKYIESKVADIANHGSPSYHAGSIVGAAFLSHFMKTEHWAHIDVAGTAFNDSSEYGATGRPVPMLVQYFIDQVEKSDQKK